MYGRAGLGIAGASEQNCVQSCLQNRGLLVLGLFLASLKNSLFGLSIRSN